MERKARFQGILRTSQTSSFGFPSKGALPEGPLHGIPRREIPHHYSPSSPVYEPPPHPYTRFPSDGKGPPWREIPASRDFPNISSRVPNVGASPSPPSPTEPLQKETIYPALKVPGRQALLQVPQTWPLWKEMPVSISFSIYPSGSPAREPSL